VRRKSIETFTAAFGTASFTVVASAQAWKQWGPRIEAVLEAGYRAGLAQRATDPKARAKVAELQDTVTRLQDTVTRLQAERQAQLIEASVARKNSLAGRKSMHLQYGTSAPGPISLKRAERAWGAALPGWVRILAEECDRRSQTQVARDLGYSGSCINLVLGAAYPGRLDRVEAAVRRLLFQPPKN
jgi:hypothetical protein